MYDNILNVFCDMWLMQKLLELLRIGSSSIDLIKNNWLIIKRVFLESNINFQPQVNDPQSDRWLSLLVQHIFVDLWFIKPVQKKKMYNRSSGRYYVISLISSLDRNCNLDTCKGLFLLFCLILFTILYFDQFLS